jgi:hypothetical protein
MKRFFFFEKPLSFFETNNTASNHLTAGPPSFMLLSRWLKEI